MEEGFRGFQGVEEGFRGFQRVLEGFRGWKGFSGVQKVEEG